MKKKTMNKQLLAGLILTSALTGVAMNAPIEAEAAADTIKVTENTASKITLESTKLRVWLNKAGNYGMVLLPGENSIFYSNQNAYANVWRTGEYDKSGYPKGFNNLTFVSMKVTDDNVIEQVRTDGQFNYTLRISIVNATTQGGYMKVELEAKNITNTAQNVGISFNADTKINGSDSSPFKVIENGWIGYYNNVQATAYYQNVFHTTQADAIYLGKYNTQAPMPLSTYSVGQIVSPGDSGAGFYYKLESVPAGGVRKESWIIGLGPQNNPPTFSISAPTNGQTVDNGQTVNISGTVKDTDVGDDLIVKWAIDGGTEQVLKTLTSTGANQTVTSSYVVPKDLSSGQHTLQFWVMDDKGASTSAITRTIKVKENTAPTTSVTTSISQGQSMQPGDAFTISGTATDSNPYDTLTGYYQIDNEPEIALEGKTNNGTLTFSGTATIPEDIDYGEHKISVYAKDYQGEKSANKEYKFYIPDETPPEVTATTDILDESKQTYTINVKGEDADSGIKRIQLPNGNFVYDDEVNLVVDVNGEYTFLIEDNEGNVTPYTVTISDIMQRQKYMVKVIGTFESTTLDVRVPVVSSFMYNSNTEEMNAQKMSIESFTNAPVSMNLQEISVSEESEWKPELVAPNSYTDSEWTNLTQRESNENVALGINRLEGEGWLATETNNELWSTDTNNNGKMGTIRNHGVIEAEPILKSGNSLSMNQILTANYIYEFGLEE